MTAIKLAFTGTGWAARVHAKAAQASSQAELAAVVNHKPESMAAFAAEFGIPRQYRTVPELLADGGVEALVVSTPNSLHAPETIAALQAGVHVLVEKPMAMNAAEAEAMAEAAQRSGALLMVAQCFRFDPEVVWLRDQVAQGRLGPIIRTRSIGVHVAWGPRGWFVDPALAGGGAMADVGIHAIDTTRSVLGDPQPEAVYAQIGAYYTDHAVDDTATLVIHWAGGVTSFVEAGWWQPHADGPFAATQVYGTKGFGQIFPAQLKFVDPERAGAGQVESGPSLEPQQQTPQHKYDSQLAYFLECIREARQPTPGGEHGIVGMRILDAAYQSSKTGEIVRL